MGEAKTIYVLMVTAQNTVMPTRIEDVIEASCTFDYFPAAASFDVEPLEAKGYLMKEIFPSVKNWEIASVPFIGDGD